MKTKKLAEIGKRLLSSTLVTTLLLTGVVATDIYYGYSPYKAEAATLSGTSASVTKPVWNSANLPDRDTTGTVTYWYAGNGFHALNQLNGGVIQTGKGTDGHLKIYSDTYGARLVETKDGSKVVSVKGNFSGGSDFTSFAQRSDLDFTKTWELMDTDAVWDDQYLFAQYKTNAFEGVTSAFTPTILTSVEDWYSNGFSYDGSKNSRPTISAPGTSWFSNAEKSAVKSASVKTDGSTDSSNTNTDGDHIDNAHLFAASIDEMYYNPTQVEEVIANLAADKSTTYNGTDWQYARSYLWSRSFWGVDSGSVRVGFCVNSSGRVYGSNVANEFAVAPAFYLDLEKVVMARSASNAAADAAASTGLSAYNAKSLDTSDGIKFLVQDSNFANGFTSSVNNKKGTATIGSTYSVDYSGATTTKVNDYGTGSQLVISAALYDENGKIAYYGPLSKVTSTSGSVSVTIPSGITEGTYTLALFEEQLGGTSSYDTSKNTKNGTSFSGTKHTYSAYETDYQSGSVAYMSLDVVNDYHTGVSITNNNDSNLSLGDSILASEISATFTSSKGTLNDAVNASDIYVIAASDWEGHESKSNSKLVKTLVIPDSAVGSFDYYIVVKDLSAENEYWASEKQTVDCSENATGFDSETWYTYDDRSTGIVWKYKLDGNGDIIGLYTKSNIVKIVDNGGTLNIPAKVAGRTVVKIGGGDETTPVVPASERAWTSLSLPSTVTTLNDYAFYQSTAQAQITIPSNVTAIGIKAFYQSEITGVKISEMNGTIGSYAFGKTTRLGNVSLKGGERGLTVSTVAFADTTATDVTIRGNVTVNKKAFRNNTSLHDINISGNVQLGESAFVGCSAVTNLTLNGTTDIGSYAFDGLSSLERLYLPVGTTLHAYSFNGTTALKMLESDVNLPAHSFENSGAIETIILDGNVVNISYDWEGHTTSVSSRKIYIKNDTMQIEYYGKGGTYYSALGSSGDVTVYVPNTSAVDLGTSVTPSDKGVLTLNGFTSYAHSGDYSDYIKGTASTVTIRTVYNVDTQIKTDHIESLKDTEVEKKQTNIDAYYSGTILTTTDIDKSKMTVVRVYGSEEGDAYSIGEFYVVRTTEFAEEAAKDGGITEEAIAGYEPVHAIDSDLDPGATTGTVSVTVVVFYDEEEEGQSVRKYYSCPVSIRVEEYTSKSYIEQVYGSYDAIADKLVQLDAQIKDLQKKLDAADVDSIEELTNELNSYKVAYAQLVATLEEFMANNNASNGYFGTTTEGGTTTDVVFIEGNPIPYEDAKKNDSEGNKIYKAQYDVDGNGTPEEVYFVVKNDGVHIVDATGNAVSDESGKDLVYKDTLGALEREAAAQLVKIKKELSDCQDGIAAIKEALENAGFEFNGEISDVDQIVEAVNSLAGQVDTLETQLQNANDQIDGYASALDTIYKKLTGKDLSADGITGLANTLNAIVSKIEGLNNSLDVAKATVADLNTKLNNAQGQVSQLESELTTTKADLAEAESKIAAAKAEKDKLVADYEKAIKDGNDEAAAEIQKQIDEKDAAIAEFEATKTNLEQKEQELKEAKDTVAALQKTIADKNKEIEDLQARLDALSSSAEGFKMTVDTANTLFGLQLQAGTSDEDVYAAIQDYVKTKLDADATIVAIQNLLNTQSSGEDLVNEVSAAITNSGDSGNSGNNSGSFDDSVINTNSNNYKTGFEAGKASVDVSDNSDVYKRGYAAGLAAGNKGNSGDYTSGYQTGYAAGVASVDTKTSYNSGYNAGYSAGVSAGSKNDSSTKELTSQISTLTNQVTTLTSQKATLEAENKSLQSQVTTLTADKTDLQNKLDTALKKVGTSTASTNNNSNNNSSATTGATSTSKKETASTTSTATTTQKKDTTTSASVPKPVEDEDIEYEGSTFTASSFESTSGTKYALGESVPMKMPTNITVKSDGQLATIKINKISSPSDSKDVTLDQGTYGPVDEESLNNAIKILTYYQNNLDKLGDFGSLQLKQDAADSKKEVIFDMICAIDVTPSEEQLNAIKNGEKAHVVVTSEEIKNGDYYIAIHESKSTEAEREGVFDVTLVRGDNNSISLDLEDLSPITITKVTVNEIEELVSDTTTEITTEEVEPSSIEQTEESNTGFRIVMYILLVIAIGGVVVLFVLAQKRKNGGFPSFKKNK